MFTFTIRPDAGEEYELKATSRDVYMWERTGKGRTLHGFMEAFSLSACYEIAHIAARRQQTYAGTLEEFAQSVDLDFREDAQEPEPDPTQPAASHAGSSS